MAGADGRFLEQTEVCTGDLAGNPPESIPEQAGVPGRRCDRRRCTPGSRGSVPRPRSSTTACRRPRTRRRARRRRSDLDFEPGYSTSPFTSATSCGDPPAKRLVAAAQSSNTKPNDPSPPAQPPPACPRGRIAATRGRRRVRPGAQPGGVGSLSREPLPTIRDRTSKSKRPDAGRRSIRAGSALAVRPANGGTPRAGCPIPSHETSELGVEATRLCPLRGAPGVRDQAAPPCRPSSRGARRRRATQCRPGAAPVEAPPSRARRASPQPAAMLRRACWSRHGVDGDGFPVRAVQGVAAQALALDAARRDVAQERIDQAAQRAHELAFAGQAVSTSGKVMMQGRRDRGTARAGPDRGARGRRSAPVSSPWQRPVR